MKEFEICNIPQWDYTGEGLKVILIDNHLMGDYEANIRHSENVRAMFNMILPKALVDIKPYGVTSFTEALNYDMVIMPTGGSPTLGIVEKLQEIVKKDIPIFISSGNDKTITKMAKRPEVIAIGAVHLVGDKIEKPSYSGAGQGLFCVGFSNILINGIMKQGTSYSMPFVAAMVGKWIEWYKEKFNIKPTIKKIKEFIKENCNGEGYNTDTGYGLFILPKEVPILVNEPSEIIIHHSATDDGTLESIRKYHVEVRGWGDIGYHYLILKDGTLCKGRDENREGAHTLTRNLKSIGVCLVGNFDNYIPNKAQLQTLSILIKDIWSRYGILPLHGHNEYANKSCPGKQFPWKELKDMLKEQEHWAEKHYRSLKAKGIDIHEKRYDEPITRGEMFALLDRIVGK